MNKASNRDNRPTLFRIATTILLLSSASNFLLSAVDLADILNCSQAIIAQKAADAIWNQVKTSLSSVFMAITIFIIALRS